ncbi:MAG: MBOAT family protein [Butyrivibrio sp.]|nr:MBOAT family protein [Butyrivibrio sp.]
MLFNSYEFLIFLPIVIIGVAFLPDKYKRLFLLLASYFFYMNWNPVYGLLLLFCTVITYGTAIFIENSNYKNDNKKTGKKALILMLIIVFGLLFYYKYFTWIYVYTGKILTHLNSSLSFTEKNIILPVGISFFTFQSVAYVIDVYRKDVKAEKNFIKYALFISFFPQLVAGPIERSRNLLKQLDGELKVTLKNVKEGIYILLWGYFLKIVIADRAAIYVDTVYTNYADKVSVEIIIATVLFAFQIYGDFGGYSMIAKGCAKFIGIDLMDNFNSPYTSLSVREFWRRWHISLNTWFTDYLYIPLGGSRKGKFRTYVNTLTVFLLSGLWHGAGITYVLWGLINGIYILIEKAFNIKNAGNRIIKPVQGIITFILVDFAWLFFRSQGISNAAGLLKTIISTGSDKKLGYYLTGNGLDAANMILLLISVLLLIMVDTYTKDGKRVRYLFMNKAFFIQSFIIILSVTAIMLFGIWGNEYDAANFIYFRF